MVQPKPLPNGSIIEQIDELNGSTYRWTRPRGGPFHFFIVAFFIVWVCFWIVALVAVTTELLNGKAGPGKAFLLVWLAAWTVGGAFAIFFLYLLLRPPKPEQITLKGDTFSYDSGTSVPTALFNPWWMMRYSDPNEAFRHFFRRRIIIDVPKGDLGNVVLQRIGDRQRLYFDRGADRIEIGEHLREPEREWLADVISAWQAE